MYQKLNFLISQPKHMLWVLKKYISMRWFSEHPKNMLKMMVKKKNIPEEFCLSKPWLPIS